MQDELKIWVLRKMFRNGYWIHRYINFDDLVNPKIPRRELGKALKELEKKDLIHKKKGNKSSTYRYALVNNKKQIIEILYN